MSEWTVHLDTPEGVVKSEEDLLRFDDAIHEMESAGGPVTSANKRTGSVGATFTVEAETVKEAVDVAVSVFDAALESVGIPPGSIVHIEVEPAEERAFAVA
jgi:hypothetical protein